MMQAHDVQIEKLSPFEVRGKEIELLFAVVVAALKWSEADAEMFVGAARKRHPELDGYTYVYEMLPPDPQIYRPATVKRIYFGWRREISGPEPREQVETEFDALRQALLSMVNDYASNARSS